MKHLRQSRNELKYPWPGQPFHVVLVEPEIPANTGNIARLCAATGSILHLVGQLGFKITDRHLKRAGLDYWDAVKMVRHPGFTDFVSSLQVSCERDETRPCSTKTDYYPSSLDGHASSGPIPNFFLFSTKGKRLYTDAQYRPGDALIFGSETKGLPDEILEAYPDSVLAIPIRTDAVRSLNLATAAGIVLYEGLRQATAG
jgi:tRNA (cytidine/uridine-2'-O-)-methyltransferase